MLLLLFMLLEVGLHFTWHFVKTDYSVTISICRSHLFEIKCRVLLCCAVIHANCHRFDVICTVGLYSEK